MKKAGHTANKKCLICVTNGAEDLETVAITDTLRRSRHLDVTLAKVPSADEGSPSDLKDGLECTLMQGIRIVSTIQDYSR
mgnify:CR=1 FL=1